MTGEDVTYPIKMVPLLKIHFDHFVHLVHAMLSLLKKKYTYRIFKRVLITKITYLK